MWRWRALEKEGCFVDGLDKRCIERALTELLESVHEHIWLERV